MTSANKSPYPGLWSGSDKSHSPQNAQAREPYDTHLSQNIDTRPREIDWSSNA